MLDYTYEQKYAPRIIVVGGRSSCSMKPPNAKSAAGAAKNI